MNWRYRLLPFAFWSIPAAFVVLVMLSEHGLQLYRFIGDVLPFYYWALFTTPIIELCRRLPITRSVGFVLSHLWRGWLLGALCGVIMGVARFAFFPETISSPPALVILNNVLIWSIFGLIFYMLLAAIGYLLVTQERLRERESSLAEAQLHALRMQLHPHFLFNTLNTVTMYIREGDSQTSIGALTRLSELLRRLLDDNAHEVPLGVELDHIRKYLEIETLRFSDRLRVEYDIRPGMEDVMVPSLILQPLVENAIRHGIGAKSDARLIRIVAYENKLQVINQGPPLNGTKEGIGLSNTRQRLALIGGKLDLYNQDDTVVGEITLPRN
ncbi:MAG TPA: histidine kinase [Longimicrobiales bacterium]|nr:histidine kinase [Longimicrobiales bacterium]